MTALPIRITLEGRWPGIYLGLFDEATRKAIPTASLLLAVRCRLSADIVRHTFAANARTIAVEQIANPLSVSAGVGLAPTSVVPPALQQDDATAYFDLRRSTEPYKVLCSSRGIAVSTIGEWPDLVMNLWVLPSMPTDPMAAISP